MSGGATRYQRTRYWKMKTCDIDQRIREGMEMTIDHEAQICLVRELTKIVRSIKSEEYDRRHRPAMMGV